MARGMTDVQLLEDDDLGSTVAPTQGHPGLPSRLRPAVRRAAAWVRRRVRPLALVALTVAVAVVVTSTLAARAERARLEALAGTPHVSAPMDSSLHPVWSARAPEANVDGLGVRDDVLVALAVDESQGQTLLGFRMVDGIEAWRTELTPAPPGSADGAITYSMPSGCVLPRTEPAVVTCLVVPEWAVVQLPDDADVGAPDRFEVRPASLQLATVSASTGRTLAGREVGEGATLTALDGDVVLAEPRTGADGATARVSRVDAATGDPLWTVELPAGPGADDSFVTVAVTDDAVAVTWRGAAHVLSPDDGTSLREPLPSNAVLPYGPHLMSWASDSTDDPVLVDVDSGVSVHVGETRWPVRAAVDDGSAEDLMLAHEGGEDLVGVDLTTGEDLWRVPGAAASGQLLVVGGRVVDMSLDGLDAWDARSGEALWSVTPSSMTSAEGVTDGRHVFVLLTGRDGVRVGAFAVADGELSWTARVPDDIGSLVVLDNRLFGSTGDGLTRLTTDAAGRG